MGMLQEEILQDYLMIKKDVTFSIYFALLIKAIKSIQQRLCMKIMLLIHIHFIGKLRIIQGLILLQEGYIRNNPQMVGDSCFLSVRQKLIVMALQILTTV